MFSINGIVECKKDIKCFIYSIWCFCYIIFVVLKCIINFYRIVKIIVLDSECFMFDNVYKEGSIYIGIIVYVNCYFYILLVIKFLVNYILFVYEECCGYENIIN